MIKTISFKDLFGKDISVGDTVAVAFPSGSSNAYLRVGKVIKLIEKEQPPRLNRSLNVMQSSPDIPVVTLEWDKELSYGWVPEKPTRTENTEGRFIKIK